ncbi:MAG: YigZ family protein [Bacteroidetes bacterium]|nr:YigZ family protein [Candidatus Colenecus caballi]
MAQVNDTYQTIQGEAKAQFTEQRSRFISFAWHVTDVEQVKELVAALQKEYYDARHVCYAYMLGPERLEWRANDNGEPSGTAGKPILGQINSAGLTDILICVVRYFGGVKLGTSGLIEAYREAAREAIDAAEIVTKYVESRIEVLFTYAMMNDLMRIVKDMEPRVIEQEYGAFTCDLSGRVFDCRMLLGIRLSQAQTLMNRITDSVRVQPDPEMVSRSVI